MDNERWKPQEDADAEDEEEELDGTAYKTVKDAILFAIDVSSSMLKLPPPSDSKKTPQDSPVSAALKCAYSLMQQRIISNPNDMMGILLFGTEKSKFQGGEADSRGALAYPHCYLLNDLDVPAADDVRRLKTMVEDPEEAKDLLVPSKEPVSMANVLFCANQIFTNKAPNFTSRRLFVVTDEDNPHFQDKALRAAATVRAKDLYDLGVIIELFPISRADHVFDRNNFYDDIIYRLSPTDPDAPAPISGPTQASSTSDGINLLQSLLSSINSKSTPRRALFSNLPLEIAPGLKISVKGHIIYKRQVPARSCYVWLGGERAQIAKGTTTQLADDPARPEGEGNVKTVKVEKADIKKAYKFGGEQVVFTPEEIASLRNFGDPVIRIIGYKPLSYLPIWASLKQSTFLYPSEEDYIGSTRVFSALHKKLLSSQLMGLAWFIARRNAAPVIAALIPGAEKRSDAPPHEQTTPPGLWLTPIPYADDIRQDPETTLVRSPDSLVDMMRTVIQQLQLPKAQYNPEKYPNPALQWHYRILQAMALEEDVPTKAEDKTIPRYRQIDKRAGGYLEEWQRELEVQFRARGARGGGGGLKTGVKREADDAAGAREKKAKTSTESGGGGMDDEAMKRHYEKQTINKLTLPVLKGWLESHHLPVHGKKSDLVDQVEVFFESK